MHGHEPPVRYTENVETLLPRNDLQDGLEGQVIRWIDSLVRYSETPHLAPGTILIQVPQNPGAPVVIAMLPDIDIDGVSTHHVDYPVGQEAVPADMEVDTLAFLVITRDGVHAQTDGGE